MRQVPPAQQVLQALQVPPVLRELQAPQALPELRGQRVPPVQLAQLALPVRQELPDLQVLQVLLAQVLTQYRHLPPELRTPLASLCTTMAAFMLQMSIIPAELRALPLTLTL